MAAVATRTTQGPPSDPTSRLSSPVEKRNITSEGAETKRNASPKVTTKPSPKKSSKRSPVQSVTSLDKPAAENPTTTSSTTTKPNPSNTTSTQPPQTTRAPSLPPPPIPLPPPSVAPAVVEEPPTDYFSGNHNRYGEEPNPFEQSFSVNDGTTPGKVLLPPASSITSPSPNLATGGSFNWGFNSLRSGPLSPAMLTGPSVFDPSIRSGLTPNESGIRSGLTPGGGGSMFPIPSPNTAALFGGFGSGTTPGTMEFHKTALAAQAQNNRAKFDHPSHTHTKLEDDDNLKNMLQAPLHPQAKLGSLSKPTHGRQPSDPFGGGDANAAASGLFLLAQQGQQHQNDNQFMGGRDPYPVNTTMSRQVSDIDNEFMTDAPVAQSNKRNSIATKGRQQSTSNGRGISEGSEGTDNSANDNQANGRNTKGKPNATKKTPVKNAVGRRKTENDLKGPPAKKQKQKSLSIDDMDDMDEDEDMMDDDGMDDGKEGEGNKKMTEEEKRKNFLERNRVAALKCRQRKKQWLANLQAKVEYYGAENDALHSQVANLRDEVIQLKTLLLAHKECPVNRSQAVQSLAGVDGISAMGQGSEYQMNHGYGVAQNAMAPPGRRFS